MRGSAYDRIEFGVTDIGAYECQEVGCGRDAGIAVFARRTLNSPYGVYELAKKRTDAEFELVDIKDFNLPLLDVSGAPIANKNADELGWSFPPSSFIRYPFSPARSTGERLQPHYLNRSFPAKSPSTSSLDIVEPSALLVGLKHAGRIDLSHPHLQ